MDKNKKVFQIFQGISEGYDKANNRISFGMHWYWKWYLAREVKKNVRPGARILDVCCGTGDMAGLLARAKQGYRITGIDFSPNMLKAANRKYGRCKGIRFVAGDAMNLPFIDGAFDCAVISFGLRNTQDYLGVLKEMTRVVKTGGMIGCLDSSYPENPVVKPLFKLYFGHMMPYLGGGKGMLEEYRWLNESTETFVSKIELLKMFGTAGLNHLKYKSFMCGCCACHTGYKTGENNAEFRHG